MRRHARSNFRDWRLRRDADISTAHRVRRRAARAGEASASLLCPPHAVRAGYAWYICACAGARAWMCVCEKNNRTERSEMTDCGTCEEIAERKGKKRAKQRMRGGGTDTY
eukprot:4721336-Pleurochrysis_carterae.AAC.1